MYADVAVPSYKGPNADSFTYEIPKDLEVKPGQLVMVPFGRKQEIGLVLSTDSNLPTTDYKLKSVDSLIFEKPFLLPYQLQLIDWMASYYLATKNNVAAAVLPELPERRQEVSGIKYQVSRTHQTLVLVPTINNIPQTMALFPKAASAVVYHSDLKPKEKLDAWQKTLSGQADYVFGTRQTIFFPAPNLKKIIILNEHDDSYKDQRAPYYDTLTVAQKLLELTQSKLEIIDSSPKITTYFNHKEVTKIAKPKQEVKTKIVSMLNEKLGGNKTPVSYDLEVTTSDTLKAGGKVLLFLNKKKESGTLYCNNCKYQESLEKEPDKCPNCGSPEIFFASLNVGSLAKQIAKLFPKVGINILAEKKGHLPFVGNQLSIDIATSAVFYQLLPKHYDLVAAISTDSTLNIPEFSAPEKAYTQITNLKRLSKKYFILQTYQVDNFTIQCAVEGNYQAFFEAQIKERQALSYPPYSQLVKLVLESKEEPIEKLTYELKSTIPQPISILGPFVPIYKKAKPTQHLIIKAPTKTGSLSEKEKVLDVINIALKAANAAKTAKQIIVDPLTLN
ncbi:hypothetical protein HY024_03265 [Candidatus Curtissbacteria bacterium]|nr:hypothetical protein [Candidatus Curtissbacteria bacterium]